jgi:type II secretory pathway pseudopilin PulG
VALAGIRAISRRSRSERGMTLVEIMVTTGLMLLVLGATLALLETSSKDATKINEQTLSLGELQTGVYSLTREIRGAAATSNFSTPDPGTGALVPGNTLDVVVKGVRIYYDCTRTSPTNSAYKACYRTTPAAGDPPPTSGGRLVIDRVLNGTSNDSNAVFTPILVSGAPAGYSVQIDTPGKGSRPTGYAHRASFKDAVYLKNASPSSL